MLAAAVTPTPSQTFGTVYKALQDPAEGRGLGPGCWDWLGQKVKGMSLWGCRLSGLRAREGSPLPPVKKRAPARTKQAAAEGLSGRSLAAPCPGLGSPCSGQKGCDTVASWGWGGGAGFVEC